MRIISTPGRYNGQGQVHENQNGMKKEYVERKITRVGKDNFFENFEFNENFCWSCFNQYNSSLVS